MERDESLTPPISPVGLSVEDLIEAEQVLVEDENIEKEACCFTCGEDLYLNSGYIRGLLNDNHHDNVLHQKEISLFSHTWPSINCDNFDRLFLTMRQQIGNLQTTAVKSRLSFNDDSEEIQGKIVRQEICCFLQYLLDYVQSEHLSNNDIQNIVNNLQTVLLHIGRLSELPNHILHTTSIGSKLTISEHCLHLHLDVYWRILSIIHIIETKYSASGVNITSYFNDDEQYGDVSIFTQILHIILWDLTYLANVRYISKVNRDEPMETTMFGCSCIKEIWTLILILTDWRSNTHIGESFWISFHHILKSCLDLDTTDTNMLMEVDDCRTVKNPPDTFKTDDVIGLNLWMLYHLSILYTQVLPSTVVTNWSAKPVSNYHDLEAVIKKLFTTPSVSESTLKKHLRTCLYLTNDWEPNTRLLITLWDFYYKRLNQNDSYQPSRSTLDGLACMDTSVVSMYDRCLQWTQAHLDSLKKDTSYQIFIRILCQHLGKLYRNGSTQEWKQVKGRIYSKFHARRLQELMEGGLYNLTVLFVSLGMTADLEDVSSKLCDFYDMLDINSITYAKRCVIWRGAFTLMLVYVSHDMDISFLAEKMSSTFQHVVNDYQTAGIDNKHNLWKLILIYLEGLEETAETSKTLLQSQYKLLGPAIYKLLTICSEQELRTTLSTLHAVITKYREIITNTPKTTLDVKSSLQYAEYSCLLWKHVYSFVVDHSQTLTPSPILADMAASFCLLALNNSEEEGNDKSKSFIEIFKHFSVSEKVNTSISCTFLSLLLPCDDVLTRLQTDLSNYEQFVINIWFRCCLFLPHGSTVLHNITRCVKKLPQFNNIMIQSELVWEDIDEVPVLFLKGLEKIHKKIESWQDKMKFQQQIIPYFTDVLKYINPVIKSWSPVDVVNRIYQMTGYLIKYCAKLIYVRQDVIVPGLINGLILPYNILNPDKPVNNIFISAVRRHLHLFLEGISKLSYDKDPFLSRKLQDIVVTYLPKFQLSGSSLMMSSVAKSVHPLVTSLSSSCQASPQLEVVKFRHHVMKLTINSFIEVKSMAVHKHHSLGFTYIKELVQRTNSDDVKIKDLTVLFGVCLEYLLLLPSTSNVWTMVINIVQDLSHCYHYEQSSQDGTLSSLSSTCQNFVSIYFKFSSTGVLKVLEKISVLLKHVVIATIEQVTCAIKDLESKRGVGVDSTLRKQYFQVLKLLGDRGAAEITELSSNIV